MTAFSRRPISVGLAQINNSFSGQNYLPYSVALLQAYAQRHAQTPSDYTFLPFIYKRAPIHELVTRLSTADVVGLSTYVWNEQISLEVARRLKADHPDRMIFMGGPQVPDDPTVFLQTNPCIDFVIHGEGERVFTQVLDGLQDGSWRDVPSVSFINAEGGVVRNRRAPRIRDLDEIPSPFLDGTFDRLLEDNPEENWIGLWESNRGCPFRCSYCDWGSATAAKVNKFPMERLKAEVEWFSNKRIEYIFCCDANFGILPRDVDLAREMATAKQRNGFPVAFSVQNTKNATERAYETQKILADSGLNKGVALSMQSVNGEALKNIQRDNISLETYYELQRRFTRDDVETFSDLILGLPGETYASFTEGIAWLIENGQHNRVQFNNLAILPNAEMGDPTYQQKHGLQVVESEIINFHGKRAELDDDVQEIQKLVVATASMPDAEWRQTRAYCWLVAFLYFDKLLQIPIMTLRRVGDMPFLDIFNAFMEVKASEFPVLAEARDFFLSEAASIQKGGPEYVYSQQWLDIFWPADEYMFIKLTEDGRLPAFYAEAQTLLLSLLNRASYLPVDAHDAAQMVVDAVHVNAALLKQPFVTKDAVLTQEYDILSFYQGARVGKDALPEKKQVRTVVNRTSQIWTDFQDWCREVVWWGNKKGAYLYMNWEQDRRPSGHH